MKAGSTAMTHRSRDRAPIGSMLVLPRPDRENPPANFWWSFFDCHDLRALGSHWTDSQQGILRWGFKGVQVDIPLEATSTLQIGSVAFPLGQCTSQKLHPCHRLFDPPYSADLAPCDFWLFSQLKEKLRGCCCERLKEMKETVAKVIDKLTQDDFIGALQKLLERYNKCIAAGWDYFKGGLSFMCVPSIEVPIRKSLETYLNILVYLENELK